MISRLPSPHGPSEILDVVVAGHGIAPGSVHWRTETVRRARANYDATTFVVTSTLPGLTPALATEYGVNQAGFVIHSAIHAARHDVDCIIHTHTVAGMAVSAMQCGLLPLAQTSMRFARIAYHDYEGVVLNLDETGRGDIRVGQVSFYADSQSPAPAQRFAPHADVLVDPRSHRVVQIIR